MAFTAMLLRPGPSARSAAYSSGVSVPLRRAAVPAAVKAKPRWAASGSCVARTIRGDASSSGQLKAGHPANRNVDVIASKMSKKESARSRTWLLPATRATLPSWPGTGM